MIINTTDLGTLVITQPNTDLPAIRISLNVAVGGSLPSGGTEGQILRKLSSAPYDTEWSQDKDAEWGQIVGTLTSQTDLVAALASKQPISGMGSYLTQSQASGIYYTLNNPSGYITANVLDDFLTTTEASQVYQTQANMAYYITEAEAVIKLSPYFLSITGGTMSGAIGFDSVGTQNIAKGSFDSGRGGYNGISLNCAVGYELNWQAGWLKAVDQSGNKVVINSESDLNIEYNGSRAVVDPTEVYTTRFDGGTNPNAYGAIYNGGVSVGDSNGLYAELTPTALRFGDGTTQLTAAVSADLTPYETTSHASSTYQPISGMSAYTTTSALTAYAYPLNSNPAGYLTSSALTPYLTSTTAAASYYPLASNPAGYLTAATLPTSPATKTVMTAYNQTGATIPVGGVVYISGAHGNDPQVSLAIANSEATSAFTIAVAETAVPNNSNGTFVTSGLLENFATNGYGVDGTPLYLSPTVAGGLTAIKPFAPYHYVRIGTVIRSHPTQGTVFIAITNGFQLDEMSDVASTAPANSNVLTFESSSGMWKDKSVSTALGYAPANQTLGNLTSSSTARTNLGLGSMALETASNYLTQSSAASVYAPLASPIFTGDARAVTPATADNDTSIATTAFVKAQAYLTTAPVTSVAGRTGAVTLSTADISGIGSYALLAGASFTGKVSIATDVNTCPINIGAGKTAGLAGIAGDVWIEANNMHFRDAGGSDKTVVNTNSSNTFANANTFAMSTGASFGITLTQSGNGGGLKITNLGTGESLRIEDETSPDATAFVISNSGRAGIGVAPDATVALSVDSTGIKFNTLTFNPTSVANSGLVQSGTMNRTDYPKELLITIGGVNYAIPARLV